VSWSSAEGRWTVEVVRTGTGERLWLTRGWLLAASGYHRYDEGFTPHFEDREPFRGQLNMNSAADLAVLRDGAIDDGALHFSGAHGTTENERPTAPVA
jgi:hypothetical protein